MDERNERFLSAVSVWEMAIKYESGRSALDDRPDTFVPSVRESSGIDTLEINEECSLLAGRLPRLHTDPFDRMLIAQAFVHGMTLVTTDPEIRRYGVRILW